MVTHDPIAVEYGNKIIHIRGGMIWRRERSYPNVKFRGGRTMPLPFVLRSATRSSLPHLWSNEIQHN